MAIETSEPKGSEILKKTQVWDSHVHIGIDRDGNTQSLKQILLLMKRYNVNKAALFPFDAINQQNSFHVPNGYVLSAYKKHPKSIIPFLRLNPNQNWKKEAMLRKKQGFRGIKLHPRAQTFSLIDKNAMEIYAFAEKSNMTVLVHTGLGTENIAMQAEKI